MKRLHINLSVADLDASSRYYTALFAAKPTVVKPDYVKWMLDNPRVNFSITTRGARKGIDHLGIQAESRDELNDLHSRLQATQKRVVEQGPTTCCYARSEKNWGTDPEGISWEIFLTTGASEHYSDGPASRRDDGACCDAPVRNDQTFADSFSETATSNYKAARTSTCCA